MVEIATTSARLIDADWAKRVPSPAYDGLTPERRRAMRLANPWSYLNVTLSPEDIDENEPVSNEQLLVLARESLDRILASPAFATPSRDAFYLYQLRTDNHVQTGLVADIPISDYQNGHIRVHEQVRQERAALLGEHLFRLGVSSSPIALTYQSSESLDQLFNQCTQQQAELIIPAQFGVEQSIWRIEDANTVARLQREFTARNLYIIDGHHRAAASLSAHLAEPGPGTRHLFGVMFPDNALQLLGFNRWIKNQPGTNIKDVEEKIRQLPGATRTNQFACPDQGQVAIYVDSQWWTASLIGDDFDTQKLFDQILQPCLGLSKTDDTRQVNLPGDKGHQQLQNLVDTQGGTGFVLAPLTTKQFMQASDQNILLPPKSTYFIPKAQSGIFLRYLR